MNAYKLIWIVWSGEKLFKLFQTIKIVWLINQLNSSLFESDNGTIESHIIAKISTVGLFSFLQTIRLSKHITRSNQITGQMCLTYPVNWGSSIVLYIYDKIRLRESLNFRRG